MATTFVRAANPIWWLPDHTGLSLNDEYYAFFLTNTLPYIPQAVYSTPNGTPYSNPRRFSPAGTLPDNLYFDPTLTYRIEVRHGNTQADALIWEINDFVPGSGSGGSTIIDDNLTVAENVITNPQFADIDFESPFTYAQIAPGTYTLDLGPGWQLVMTGANGSTTLTQVANAGSSGVAGNPPYYLDINNTGWTSVVLRQRLANNGALFGGGAVAVAFTAASVGNAETLTVSYAPSTGSATNIFQQSIPTGTLTAYKNAVDLPASTNADTGTSAYVDILFTMDGTSHFQLANIQVTGQTSNLSTGFDNPTDAPVFQEVSYEQVENEEFNVYKNHLIYKPIPSWLVGWDFPLNPAQIYTATKTANTLGGMNLSQYVWDQTIVFANLDDALSFSRNSDTNGLSISNAAGSPNVFAVIQYIEAAAAREILSKRHSVQINGYITGGGTTLQGTVSLFWTTGTSLPNIAAGTCLSLVSAVSTDGIPTAGNQANGQPWTIVPNTTHSTNSSVPFTLTSTPSAVSISGFDATATAASTTATYLAIVLAFKPLAASIGSMSLNYCSLNSGDIPTRPAPQSPDEVLRQCQYFYEKSYDTQTLSGSVTTVGMNSAPALVFQDFTAGSVGNDFLYARSFYLRYKQTKRTNPAVVLYSPSDGSSGQIYAGIWRNNTNPAASAGNNPRNYAASNFSGSANNSKDGIFLLATANAGNAGSNAILEVLQGTGTLPGDEGIMQYHYTLDSRLGIN